MPALKVSTPEEDTKADASNSASLYKVVMGGARRTSVTNDADSTELLDFHFAPQVSDATGSMKLTKVSVKSPFSRDLLVRDDCFILDNGANGKIFVWKGTGEECDSRVEDA